MITAHGSTKTQDLEQLSKQETHVCCEEVENRGFIDSALLCQADSGEGWCRECGLRGVRGESKGPLSSGALFLVCNHYNKSNSTMTDESWRDDIIRAIMVGMLT